MAPCFPSKSLDEGLRDNVPIVTTAAIQGIPENKHSVHPDILYELQLKSSILQMGVPCPKHIDETCISYPCAVKVDMSSCGRGGWLVKDADELSAVLLQIREVCGWKDPIVFQEFIPGVREVPSFQFYLQKSGELLWIGTSSGGFNGFVWTSGSVDWEKQDEYEKLVYEEFTLPIKNYLQKRGYFGLVTFEILFTDYGKYLVDVNPRIGGDTTHLLLARYLALDFGLKHSAIFDQTRHNTTAKMLTEKANNINSTCEGKIVVLSVTDLDDGCESYLSIFAKAPEKVQALFCELNNDITDFSAFKLRGNTWN